MSHAVLQQALEALEEIKVNASDYDFDTAHERAKKRQKKAIAALRKELAKPEQEPVLFIHPSTLEMASAHVGAWKPGHELPGYIALYAAPPQPAHNTKEKIE
jgi:hypothetical protein